MFELTVEIPFCAAHEIKGHPGPCAQLHGHNYRALITVSGERLNQAGMLVDFGDLKDLSALVVASLDHAYLNALPAFADINPTAEAIARHIYRGVAAELASRSDLPLVLARVTVYESERSFATYQE